MCAGKEKSASETCFFNQNCRGEKWLAYVPV